MNGPTVSLFKLVLVTESDGEMKKDCKQSDNGIPLMIDMF